jgi:hypothetical protein
VLEGVITGNDEEGYPAPHVSAGDFPSTHHTHDFTFNVTPDRAYEDLLGVQVHPDGHETSQESIEVEWESGLGAANPGNAFRAPNSRFESGGCFSAGHRRGQLLWNWPTLGDRVHVEGRWIWDRGHPPADAEIHPPRLVATTRHLPEALHRLEDRLLPGPLRPMLATRVDVFASGDGGALWNNRPGQPAFVQRVRMGEADYAWDVHAVVPRPSPNAPLRAVWQIRPGDTFDADPRLERLPNGYHVVLPWHSARVPDTAVFARTLYLYWDEGEGAPAGWGAKGYDVAFEHLDLHNSQDPGPGQFRVFLEAGGRWWWANELQPGLMHAKAGSRFPLGVHAHVVLPPGQRFRVHVDGWEGDGVDGTMGHLFDPNCPRTDASATWLITHLFSPDVFLAGSRDDPAGEVNRQLREGGVYDFPSRGPRASDVFFAQETDPNDTYTVRVRVTPEDWR